MSDPTIPGRLSAADPDLNDRQRAVFAALVALHGRNARPVSSERIARSHGIGLSSASIRGALAELESLGLLERAHASSGRVPSARGYEVFVRTLLEPAVLPPALVAEVDRRLNTSTRDVERLLHEASRVLASLTHQLGLALATTLEDEPLSSLDLEPWSERRAVLVLGLGGRALRSLRLELESPLGERELDEVADVLRERLCGHPLHEVRKRLAEDAELARHSALRIVTRAATASWSAPVGTPLLSAGAGHMADQPEFASAVHLGSLLRAVDAGAPLDRLMVSGLLGQVGVRVGVAEDHALSGCSLVSFSLPGTVPGAVGVLGPLRMDYATTLAVVDVVGTRVADILSA